MSNGSQGDSLIQEMQSYLNDLRVSEREADPERLERICKDAVWQALLFHSELDWQSVQFEPLCRAAVNAMYWIDDLQGAERDLESVHRGALEADGEFIRDWRRNARESADSWLTGVEELLSELDAAQRTHHREHWEHRQEGQP